MTAACSARSPQAPEHHHQSDISVDRDAIRSLDLALDELRERQVLMDYEKEEQKGVRRRIEDVKYKVVAHPDFVKQVKASNKRLSDARKTTAPPDSLAKAGRTLR